MVLVFQWGWGELSEVFNSKKLRKLSLLDLEINTIKNKLIPFKNDSEYAQRSQSLKAMLIKEESEQKN